MIHITAASDAATLESFLRDRFPRLPESMLRRALAQRDVKRDGQRLSAQDAIAAGDELDVYIDDRYLGDAAAPAVVYEDGNILVVLKPAGLAVDDTGRDEPTVLTLLAASYPGIALCHRLDYYTSGLLVLAKNSRARVEMERAFKERTLDKTYQCLVRGTPSPREARLSAWLRKDEKQAQVTILDHPVRGAAPIETAYRTLESRMGLSLLEVSLLTGRTHQIRAHLAAVGYPVLGDDRYGDRELNRRHKVFHQQLWACRILFHFEIGSPLAQMNRLKLEVTPRWDIRW